MIPRCPLLLLLLGLFNQNQPFYGPIISLSFHGQVHNITVNPDHYYTYRDLQQEIAATINLPERSFEAINLTTRVYLNLDSYELITNLNPSKPLKLFISKRLAPEPNTDFSSMIL